MCAYCFRKRPRPASWITHKWSLEQRNQIDRRRDCGSITAQLSIVMLPASMGLTRGYMPYQDPVYSQPKKLPAYHFHISACRPLRKLISLCRRCTIMLPALYFSLVFWVFLFCSHLLSFHFILPARSHYFVSFSHLQKSFTFHFCSCWDDFILCLCVNV